jgi:hypothetical protein
MDTIKVKDLIKRLQCLDPESDAWFYLGNDFEDQKNIAYTILTRYEELEREGDTRGLPRNLLIEDFSISRVSGAGPEHLKIIFTPNFDVQSYAKEYFDTMFINRRRVQEPEKSPNFKPDGVVEIDGIEVKTFIDQSPNCNILSYEVGTTGPQGGDTGHGGRTYFRISDDASTDMRCIVKTHDGKTHEFDGAADVAQIEIMFGGDSELDTFIEALEFAAEKLRAQRNQ